LHDPADTDDAEREQQQHWHRERGLDKRLAAKTAGQTT
jgi:hypothetical protein